MTLASGGGVRVAHATKRFDRTIVLHDVSVDFEFGKIKAVLGENGAGKSTLFKILAGYHDPEPGFSVAVADRRHDGPLRPSDAAALGFAFVHQDLALAGSLSVMENVAVGAMNTRWGFFVDWKRQSESVEQILMRLGVAISPKALVRDLARAERAVVAIARALYAQGRGSTAMLVLDEPTANLTGSERDRLFDAMRAAAAMGTAVVFCTHRLEEVMTACDEVAVLRDGRKVAEVQIGAVAGTRELAKHILGRDLEEHFPERSMARPSLDSTVLSVHNASGGNLKDVTFTVARGEVVGVTGLAGAGHDDLPRLLIGDLPIKTGEIVVGGKLLGKVNPVTAQRSGIGVLPADRKRTSGLMSASIRENLNLVNLKKFTTYGLLAKRPEVQHTLQALRHFDVRPVDEPDRLLGTLSGGNQQKVLLAKWVLKPELKCMVLHEPTQGVDVGAKRAILEVIASLARDGMAVVLVSSEHEELSHLSDRVLIVRNNRIAAEMERPTATQIAERCYVA